MKKPPVFRMAFLTASDRGGHNPVDNIFRLSYIPSMAWEVEFTAEFEAWWNTLTSDEQVEIDAKVRLLEERGPVLPRPHSDVIGQSRYANMKELRGRVTKPGGEPSELRVLYAFDPSRTAILLIGGDKTGNPDWYNQFVPIADDLFDEHLKEIKRDRRKQERDDGKKVQGAKRKDESRGPRKRPG